MIYRAPEEEVALTTVFLILENLVLKHEFGHMVFRSLHGLQRKQKESLANWFACLFSDDYERLLLKLLVPFQSDEYHDFVEIPNALGLKSTEYKKYCEKMESLLGEW